MADRMIEGDGVRLRTESFGNEAGEPFLLIMGAGAPGVYWTMSFIQPFVDAGCFVVRYDNRDTGKSTCVDYQQHPYTLDNMARDAVAVMDAYGMQAAHIAGASMGGMIAQVLMIRHADRLKTATLIMSTPLSGGGDQPQFASDDLPGPEPGWMEKLMMLATKPALSREQKIENLVEQNRMLAGSAGVFDEAEERDIAGIVVDQAVNLDAGINHSFAIAKSSPSDRRPLLKETGVPTLVIHGTEDPILPYPHGVALAETIPRADLLTLEGGGHDLNEVFLSAVTGRMLALQSQSQ